MLSNQLVIIFELAQIVVIVEQVGLKAILN